MQCVWSVVEGIIGAHLGVQFRRWLWCQLQRLLLLSSIQHQLSSSRSSQQPSCRHQHSRPSSFQRPRLQRQPTFIYTYIHHRPLFNLHSQHRHNRLPLFQRLLKATRYGIAAPRSSRRRVAQRPGKDESSTRSRRRKLLRSEERVELCRWWDQLYRRDCWLTVCAPAPLQPSSVERTTVDRRGRSRSWSMHEPCTRSDTELESLHGRRLTVWAPPPWPWSVELAIVDRPRSRRTWWSESAAAAASSAASVERWWHEVEFCDKRLTLYTSQCRVYLSITLLYYFIWTVLDH